MNKNFFKIPKEVTEISNKLKEAGFQSFLVGGCVRDLFLQKKPKDWDITTNAKPEDVQRLFTETFYENSFGTVGVVSEGEVNPEVKVIEVTPFRIEGKYSNNRHPDEVIWSENLEDDLKRRDFTVNALAMDLDSEEIIDLFEGKKDLQKGIIKTVGNAEERFEEDGLRILRAVRLAIELGFEIEENTEKAILNKSFLLKNISVERIRDELIKIIMSENPMRGFEILRKLSLLQFILPELEEGIGVTQKGEHIYDVYEHLLHTLKHAGVKNFPLETRLASLFHDIGKPATRRFSKEQNQYTFYGHDVVGAKITKKILERLKFPSKTIETVVLLVRWHMFFSDTEQITLSAVRRMIRNVGKENIWTLMDVRVCDRIGTGRPKEDPYRLRKYHSMIEEALRDPISVSQLKIGGEYLIKELKMKPGKEFGLILHILLEEVIEDPNKNTEEYLSKRVGELNSLDLKDLEALGEKAKEYKEKIEEEELQKIRSKYRVK